MDILVGKVAGSALAEDGGTAAARATVQGTVLAVRRPREGGHACVPGRVEEKSRASDERRRRRSATRVDPPGTRVLTLLITDPSGIPADAETAPYRVVVRFIRES